MPDDNDQVHELKKRIRRLEGLVAVLLVDPENADPVLWDHLLYKYARPEQPDNEFWYELLRHIRRLPFAPRWTQLAERVERLEAAANPESGAAGNLEKRLGNVESEHRELQTDAHRWLVLQSLGLSLAQVPLPRFLQVRVRLGTSNDNTITAVADAVQRVLAAFDFDIADDFPEQRGSWLKDWFVKTKQVVNEQEVHDRLAKVERALELQALGKTQAEIDKNQAEATASLLTALAKDTDAVMQVGSILLVQTCDPGSARKVIVRTLTQAEMILIEKNQNLLSSPREILAKLSEAASKETLLRGKRKITLLEDEPRRNIIRHERKD